MWKTLKDKSTKQRISLKVAYHTVEDSTDSCSYLLNDSFLGIAFVADALKRNALPYPTWFTALIAIVALFHWIRSESIPIHHLPDIIDSLSNCYISNLKSICCSSNSLSWIQRAYIRRKMVRKFKILNGIDQTLQVIKGRIFKVNAY